jgi:hypothetical protein
MDRLPIRLVIIGVVVLGVLGYRFFFVDSDEVRGFNDAMVDMVTASDAKFTPFTEYLDQYYEGTQVDVQAMTAARDGLEQGMAADRNKLQGYTVPDDELCKEFHGVCLSYVDNSWQISQKYKEVIDYISQHNPGTDDDFAAVEGMLEELLAKDGTLFQQAGACQQRMADKFDFEVE